MVDLNPAFCVIRQAESAAEVCVAMRYQIVVNFLPILTGIG